MMPTWGIVLSIVVYLGIGLVNWSKPDGERMEPVDVLVLILWPLALIGWFVSWLMDCIFGKA